MVKYQPFARRELRTLFLSWLRRHRVRVGVVVVGAFVLMAVETLLVNSSDLSPSVSWYLIGGLHVLILAVLCGAVGTTFLAHEQRAILHLRGAWGEDFTRDELRRAQRKKLIWGCVDSVTVQSGDIDHLVVTRSGGLVAIDTKWRSSAQDVDPSAMAHEAGRARVRAEGVIHSLLGAERGSHRARTKAFRVTPLVVVWGAAMGNVPEDASVNGVDFVAGDRLVDWLGRLEGEAVDEASAADILAKLHTFRSEAWVTSTRTR